MANQPKTFLSRLKTGFDAANAKVEDGLVLAVSGGTDSMALLHATAQLWPNSIHHLTVAHVNHSLRGAASDADLALVQKSADRLGVRFECKVLKPGELALTSKSSLEEAARKARYDWLTKTAGRWHARFVATAHHAEDQAETILHNVIRGTGLRGLGGMRTSRPLNDDVALIRPMLQCERSDVEQFVREQLIEFRTDQSNSDLQFTRNRIRLQLLPLLKESFNGQVVRNLNSLNSIAAETTEAMDQLAEKVLAKSLLQADQHGCRMDVTVFEHWPTVVVRESLILQWTKQGWPRQKMSYRHWIKLAEMALGKHNSTSHFPGGISASRDGSMLRLIRSADGARER